MANISMSQMETEQEELNRLRNDLAFREIKDKNDNQTVLVDWCLKGWYTNLTAALQEMIEAEFGNVPSVHVKGTPDRVARAYVEYIQNLNIDLGVFFTSVFPTGGHNSLVIIKDITINSLCAHHLFPFYGKAYFGYIPDKRLVGLSKIPRFIECLAKRPTIQEELSDHIVAHFNNYIKPIGCGVVIEAVHTCMTARGIEAHGTSTRTVALLGEFLTNPSVKQEFLDGIK